MIVTQSVHEPITATAEEPRIRLLPENVASQIAAGEVVERPASVVKELVENALDAGASRLVVDIEGGGGQLIRVSDNGEGMSAQEAVLAFQRHATSKIRSAEDMQSVETLGFRGEALPSIASVSRVTLVTRQPETVEGTRVQVTGGEIHALETVGAPVGTSVTVTDLFHNVPARLKFLKSPRTELSHVHDILARLACARSDVCFLLRHEGTELLRTPGANELLSTIGALQGGEFARTLLPLGWERAGIRLNGYVAPPTVTRPTRAGQNVFVNGRSVRSRTVTHALDAAYRGTLAAGRFAPAILLLELDPALVDVNVHPSKSEVRFVREWEVHNVVREGVAAALRHPTGSSAVVREVLVPVSDLGRVLARDPVRSQQAAPPAAPTVSLPIDAPETISSRPISQLWESYILADTPTGLLIIDQHLAHERVLFQRLLFGGKEARRELSHPVSVQVSARQSSDLDGWLPMLERLGFELEHFGTGAWLVRAVPSCVPTGLETRVLLDILDSAFTGTPADSPPIERLAAATACRAAIKKGTPLGMPEMRRLLGDLELAGTAHTCPHGCPIAVEIPYTELLRRFKRA